MAVYKRYKGKRISCSHPDYAKARWWIYKRLKGKVIHQSVPEANLRFGCVLACLANSLAARRATLPGSGKMRDLWQISQELSRPLSHMFLRDSYGKRPVFGNNDTMQQAPNFGDHLLFFEYFHGDKRPRGRGEPPDQMDRFCRQTFASKRRVIVEVVVE